MLDNETLFCYNLCAMNDEELSRILNTMYNNAPDGDKVAMIHLFGIMFADEISGVCSNVQRITEGAKIPTSYQTEVSRGIRLRKYVSPSPELYKWVLAQI